jgi:glycosyltransferase involved in cell wall biosynthesis
MVMPKWRWAIGQGKMNGEMKNPFVSIVINNYNYAQFLGSAIDSALSQDTSGYEVIVVDDGSSDDSAAVIAGYGDRVRPLLKENGGQASALSVGFSAIRGDIVIFLDSDDILAPDAVREVSKAFSKESQLARVQYRMGVVNIDGNSTGESKPSTHVPVPSGDIRQQVLRFPFDLAWLPTSGNAFATRVLRRIMPIPGEFGRINADYYLVHTAALFGTVLFLDKTLAYYRVHGMNNFESVGPSLDMERLRSTIFYDELTYQWIRVRAQEAGLGENYELPQENLSVSSAASRLTSLKLEPQAHPIPGDRLIPLISLGIRSALGRSDTSPLARIIFSTWFILAGLAPRRLSRLYAEMFFFPERRQAFTRVLGRLHRSRASDKHEQEASPERVVAKGIGGNQMVHHAQGDEGEYGT